MTKTIKENVQSKKISSDKQKIEPIYVNMESGVQSRKIEPYEQYKFYFSIFFYYYLFLKFYRFQYTNIYF